jgi:FecR protein
MLKPSLTRFSFILLATACSLVALPAMADSQARIVRLSDVQGSVQINKNTGLGFEKAFVNLPITEGAQLRTGSTGRAEIEFEDGSSIRLAPNTSVDFTKLSLADAGKRISQLNLVDGMAYVNWLGKDDFSLNFSHESVSLDHAAHFRVDTSSEVANVAVFKGDVEVESPSGKVNVAKKKTASFDADKYTLANKVPEEPLDSWDKESIDYHNQYAKNNSASPYGYGLADLNYYGAYSNVPGYGMMWQPYFTGVGWDPFMDGAWSFYPGFGYMFASAYPWGWMPYRYGNWMFIPGMGWMWQPGGWNTWLAVPRYTPTTFARVNLVPPAAGTTRTLVVGRAATNSLFSSRMVVDKGSAGMGIPRGSLGNLGHLNHQVAKSGSAEVRPAPQFSATPTGRASAPSGGRHSTAGSPSMAGPSMSGGHPSSAGHASSPAAPHR